MLDPKRDATSLKTELEVLGFKLACAKASVVGMGKGFVVECKGMITDSFPLRYKLFKYYLHKHRSKMKCYLVRNHKQVDEMITELLNK